MLYKAAEVHVLLLHSLLTVGTAVVNTLYYNNDNNQNNYDRCDETCVVYSLPRQSVTAEVNAFSSATLTRITSFSYDLTHVFHYESVEC